VTEIAQMEVTKLQNFVHVLQISGPAMMVSVFLPLEDAIFKFSAVMDPMSICAHAPDRKTISSGVMNMDHVCH